jgi:hypothetical protein
MTMRMVKSKVEIKEGERKETMDAKRSPLEKATSRSRKRN